jgi:hypothetical protein
VLFAIFIRIFGVRWYYANVVSFILINLVHYALSIRLVFESGARFAKHQEVLLAFLASGVGLLVNQLALYVLVSFLGLEVLIAIISPLPPLKRRPQRHRPASYDKTHHGAAFRRVKDTI